METDVLVGRKQSRLPGDTIHQTATGQTLIREAKGGRVVGP